jgi:hypothetical protein
VNERERERFVARSARARRGRRRVRGRLRRGTEQPTRAREDADADGAIGPVVTTLMGVFEVKYAKKNLTRARGARARRDDGARARTRTRRAMGALR